MLESIIELSLFGERLFCNFPKIVEVIIIMIKTKL
jgi:hypothetical protein